MLAMLTGWHGLPSSFVIRIGRYHATPPVHSCPCRRFRQQPLVAGFFFSPCPSSTASVPLDTARWSPRNAARLQLLLDQYGRHSPAYRADRKPYAVFDWDNTCIMNDCEEALLMYQINHLQYKLTPDEFRQVVWRDVPDETFMADYKTVDGKPVRMADIAADVVADYRWLYANYQGWPAAVAWKKCRPATSSRISAPSCISCMTPFATASRWKSATSGSSISTRT
jgi:hypothetical protein